MILAGCTGLGVWYGGQFKQQMIVLKELCHVLELFLSEIRFARCTLPEGCLRVARRVSAPFCDMLTTIYERSCENTGESFGDLCSKVFADELQQVNISKEDKALFAECFTKSGYEEGTMQLRMMEQGKEELEKKIALLEAGMVSRCRLALSLGTMSGLLIVILLW